MIKKLFLLFFCLSIFTCLTAQNVQFHFAPRHGLVPGDAPDPGKNYFFSTVEMFKPDKWGSTFGFIDMSYAGNKGSINTAYWEIARDLKFWKAPIMAHVEYNGGIVEGVPNAIPNAYLVGASYPFVFGKAFMSTYVVYKCNAFEKTSNDIQWTVTWNCNLLNNKLSMSGFMDLWTENKDRMTGEGDKKVILLTQPQFWFNATEHLAVGTEIEISSDFYYDRKVYVLPTLAAKWQF